MFILRWKGRIKQLLLRAISNAKPGESYENPIKRFKGSRQEFFFFLTQESQKSVVGNIQNKKQQPNSVEAWGLIFHVGISIVDRGSPGGT